MHAYGRVLALCRGATDVEGYALRAAAREGREDLARASGASRPRRTELIALRELAVEARDPRLVARALTRQARYKLETYAADADRDTVAAVRAARARRRGAHRGRGALGARGVPRATGDVPRGARRSSTRRSRRSRARDADAAPPARPTKTGRARRARCASRCCSRRPRSCGRRARVGEARPRPRPTRSRTPTARGGSSRPHTRSSGWRASRRAATPTRCGSSARASRSTARSGSRERIAEALVRGGQAWAALGQLDRALAWVQRARDLLASLGRAARSPRWPRSRCTSRSRSCCSSAATSRARRRRSSTRARASARSSRATRSTGCTLGDARLHLARRQHRQARAAAEAAERVARESGMVVEALHGRAYAAEACAGLGDRASARAWLDSVLGDPHFADPVRVFRGDRVVAACVRALRYMGDGASAEVLEARLAVMRQRVAATAPMDVESREAS